jgi:hypothetical protein
MADEADVYVTNSVIGGADAYMPMHVVTRGGISLGITQENTHNVYQGTVSVGLYLYLSEHPYFQKIRGTIPAEDLLPTMSIIFVHEFGHLLKRLIDYSDLSHSVHTPAATMSLYEWYLDIANNEAEIPEKWTYLKYFDNTTK